MTNAQNSIGIVKITPTILEKGQFWFEKNEHNIKKEAKKITSWWNMNYKEFVKDEIILMSELMRLLNDWGYIKVNEIKNPGEFANRGGILDIFPINSACGIRLEYVSNSIENITKLENIKIKNTQEKLKKLITKQQKSHTTQNRLTKEEQKELANTLVPETYVVHMDHGIAKLQEISQFKSSKFQPDANPPQEEKVKNNKETHLILQYAQGDKLYVPLSVGYKVSPYIGFGEPKLTRLGGNIWEKTKRKVKEDLIETARYLAKIYAKREITTRNAYNLDSEIFDIAEHGFEYQETPDQLQAMSDVKNDLLGNIPMDRIICGDVGFGKTEVALRATAYAISSGYQVALIAPTTILAHQHYKTFKKRFSKTSYPITISKLTRIEKPIEQQKILEDIKNKKCDIVIGTHRLLQKDISFNNIGLLIIDEEQRFGVKQKELFKEKHAELDILSLSATPIPRTLYFALSGLRDMSVITTPPFGRKPIITKITKFNKSLIKQAIKKELNRNGQVYYLHNKIESLPKTVDMLQELIPGAKISFMHAKLPEEKLIQTIDKFAKGNIDILVTTTIIENGLDLANVNTLIADNSARLGLAQAHQIRGRIGRSKKQAYAYFLYSSKKLPPKAKLRLHALKNSQHLGAGYEIAMRDLEIRGAGNLLGKEQSGSIAKVGFNLYCQLLSEAIEELRSQSDTNPRMKTNATNHK